MNPARYASRAVRLAATAAALLGLAAMAQAQPSLSSLWPNDDGLLWTYNYVLSSTVEPSSAGTASLQFAGTVMTVGGQAQVLVGNWDAAPGAKDARGGYPGLLGAVWQARPDLRAGIAARYGKAAASDWDCSFIHDGYFMKSPTNIQMWQPSWNHPTWTYLTSDLSVGSTFTHQLIPELASDIFLHGTVAAIDDDVTTPAGHFGGSVRVDYLIDMGVTDATDESGNLIGHSHAEIRGWVQYVPDIGPVAVREESVPYVWADCTPDPCPQSWLDLIGVVVTTKTLELRTTPVGPEGTNWGSLKAAYR